MEQGDNIEMQMAEWLDVQSWLLHRAGGFRSV